jgi:hypothetical protein
VRGDDSRRGPERGLEKPAPCEIRSHVQTLTAKVRTDGHLAPLQSCAQSSHDTKAAMPGSQTEDDAVSSLVLAFEKFWVAVHQCEFPRLKAVAIYVAPEPVTSPEGGRRKLPCRCAFRLRGCWRPISTLASARVRSVSWSRLPLLSPRSAPWPRPGRSASTKRTISSAIKKHSSRPGSVPRLRTTRRDRECPPQPRHSGQRRRSLRDDRARDRRGGARLTRHHRRRTSRQTRQMRTRNWRLFIMPSLSEHRLRV